MLLRIAKILRCLRCASLLTAMSCATVLFCARSALAQAAPGGSKLGRAEALVQKHIERTMNKLPQFERDHGQRIANIPAARFGNSQGLSAPRHPLNLISPGMIDGHLIEQVSWLQYMTDSVMLLHPETFPACLEPRLVGEGKGNSITHHDPANALMNYACQAYCTRDFWWNGDFLVPITPQPEEASEEWKVISYYWPQLQISVNKAGAQMISPAIFGEEYGARLPRSRTQNTEFQGNELGEDELGNYINSLGIDTSLFKDSPLRVPGTDYFLQEWGDFESQDTKFARGMRPNAFWRAANERPKSPKGWQKSELCLFDAIDPETKDKKIVALGSDQGMLALYSRYPELKSVVNRLQSAATTTPATNIEQAANNTAFQSSLCPSYRMQELNNLYGGLSEIGIKQGGGRATHMDYCMPGGGELNGSMTAEDFMPELQADAIRVANYLLLAGSRPLLSLLSGLARSGTSRFGLDDKRLSVNHFTYYKERRSGKRQRYSGMFYNAMQPFPEYPKVFLDKLQRIYPPQPVGRDPDGSGGMMLVGDDFGISQSINNLILAKANVTRGSHCFAPEDLPNYSAEDQFFKREFPIGLLLETYRQFGETRWAMWNRRIVCQCKIDGFVRGCQNFNTGDDYEANYAGTVPQVSIDQLPAFNKAMYRLDQLALKTGAR